MEEGDWISTSDGCVARVVVLGGFMRQLCRGKADMFCPKRSALIVQAAQEFFESEEAKSLATWNHRVVLMIALSNIEDLALIEAPTLASVGGSATINMLCIAG